MSKLTVGVIGCGAFGEKHIAVYSSLESVDLKVICDTDSSRVREVADKFDVAHWTTDIHEILKDESIDAVSIATPEMFHYEHCMKALENNKHVLIEKPMATEVEHTDKLISVARKKNLILMPGHILRFEPRYVQAYQKSKEMGNIYSIYSKRNLPKNLRSIYTRVHPAEMTMPHDIDLVLWFLDSEPLSVYSVDKSTQNNGQIDLVWSLITFENGAVVCLESSWLLPEREGIFPDSGMEIIGEKGTIKIEYPARELVYVNEQGVDEYDISYWPEVYGEIGGAIKTEIEHFIESVKNKSYSQIVPPEVSAKSIRLTKAIIKSAKQQKVIKMNKGDLS